MSLASEGSTVLVIEDDAIVGIHLREALSGWGHRVIGPVATTRAALAAVERERPDLVLADIRLAGGDDGIETVRALRATSPIPAIFLSAHADDATRARALGVDPYGYLGKPVRDSDLRATLETALLRHRYEQSLAERERQLAEAQRLGGVGSFVWDAEAARLTVSDELALVTARSRDELEGWSLERLPSIAHPEDRAAFRDLLDPDAPRQGDHAEAPIRVVRPGGEVRFVDVRVRVARGEGGLRLYASMQDVTDRRSATDALRDREARLAALLDATPDGILVVDEDGAVLVANRAAGELFGREPGALRGRHVDELFPEQRFLGRGLLARDGRGRSLLARTAGGADIPLEVMLSHTTWNGRLAIVAGLRDVRERLRAEAELRERDEQLRHTQKLEALGNLAAGVAHDFNNMLTAVLGLVDLLDPMVAHDPEGPAIVEELRGAGRRATELTRQLLALSRRRGGKPIPLDLAASVRAFEGLLARALGQGVELELDLGPGTGAVLLDPSHLEQVLLHLATFASDGMPEGGRIVVRTRAAEDGRSALLEVSDSTSGLEAAVVERLFEPFYAARVLGRGAGLGLATVEGIVKQAGGAVEARSARGEGTTFAVSLPRPPEPRKLTPLSLPAVRGGTERILLVDDDAAVRQVAGQILRRAGYHVRSAVDGAEALALVEAGEPFDLLLTDVLMPRLGGAALGRAVRSLRPSTPIVFISGFNSEGDAIRELGALVSKPFTLEELLLGVRGALDGSPRQS